MCIFGGKSASPPPLPPPPPQVPTAGDQDVNRARADETARLRALSGSGSTLLTSGKTMEGAMPSGKAKLGQ